MVWFVVLIIIMIIIYQSLDVEPFSINFNKVFVINLDKDNNRLKSIVEQCNNSNLNCQKIKAINGRYVNIDEIKKKGILTMNEDSFFNHNKHGRDSLKGSIGCALSHRKTWKRISKMEDGNYLILEDDVVLPTNFNFHIEQLWSRIPKKWDIIFLGGVRRYGKLEDLNILKAVKTSTNFWNNCGLYAYIIRPQSAKKMVSLCTPINNYIDIQLNRHYDKLNAYYIVPSLVKHNFDVKSTRNIGDGDGYTYSNSFIDQSNKITYCD